MNSSTHISGRKLGGGIKLGAVLAALFCSAVLGYMAGLRAQTNTGAGGPEKTYEIKLGEHLDLRLTAGSLGVAVIFVLTILLAVAVLLALIAYRRTRQAEGATRKLEREIAVRQQAEHALLGRAGKFAGRFASYRLQTAIPVL